jgi:shikimate kinase
MKKESAAEKKSNIALIGFMGVGKSAVGQELAAKTGKQLVETDSLIVKKAGKSIPEIFQGGEIAFRELEIEVIKEIFDQYNQVIACGGGVVLNKINIDRLRQKAVMVWLTASPSTIFKRIKEDGASRPLLKTNSTTEDIRNLLKFRMPYYERAADIKIDTKGLTIDEVVKQILIKLKENANNRS